MSLNRCRNVFTLSDFHFPPAPAQHVKSKLKRRQSVDVFEKDPFKIQSYNFRYAERPKFPIPNVPQPNKNNSAANDCRTFFYNEDFPHTSNVQRSLITPHNSNVQRSQPTQQNHDSAAINLTKFQEYRRRKYLQDASVIRNLTSYSTTTYINNPSNNATQRPHSSKLLNLYYGQQQKPQQYRPTCDQSYAKFPKANNPYVPAKVDNESQTYQKSMAPNLNIRRDYYHSSATKSPGQESKDQPRSWAAYLSSSNQRNGNLTQPTTTNPITHQRCQQSPASTSQGVSISRGIRRGSSSGCEINININSGENDTRSENVTIKIETESRNRFSSFENKPTQQRLASSASFTIDKRLSKFSLNKERVEPPPLNNASRLKADRDMIQKRKIDQEKLLTSIYSPQLLQAKPKSSLLRLAQSRERMPSMFPFRSYSDLGSYHDTKTKDLLAPRKSHLQRVGENMGYSLNISKDTNKSAYNDYSKPSCSNEAKLLNSSTLTDKQLFLKKFNNSAHSLHTRKAKVSSLHSLPTVETRMEQKSLNPKLHRSHSKLPINVNINVFADKLKVLKQASSKQWIS